MPRASEFIVFVRIQKWAIRTLEWVADGEGAVITTTTTTVILVEEAIGKNVRPTGYDESYSTTRVTAEPNPC